MCALPLNLLVLIGANLPPEVLGEVWSRDDDTKGYIHKVGVPNVDVPHGQRDHVPGRGPADLFGDRGPPKPSNDSPASTCGSGSGAAPMIGCPVDGFPPRARGASFGDGGLGRRSSAGDKLREVLDRGRAFVGEATSSGASAPSAPSSRQQGAALVDAMTQDEESLCRLACPGFLIIPRILAEPGMHFDRHSVSHSGGPGKVIIVMSYDNIAALVVICALSILGAIYLWKICTRKSCACRLCLNQYRQLDLIGSGGYGSVYLIQRLCDGQRFVSKKIMVRNITEVDEYSKEAKELVTLRHRHIVSYEEDFVHVEYGTLEPKTYFIIIMEHCPEGDLKEKIEQDFCSFTEEWVRTVFAQLLQAVQYLHSKNVIHRDLKSQNVFLAEDGHVRLGDFGLCRHTRNQAIGSATFSHAGTDCYMAPEMLSSSRYGKPADIWSLGCVLYELCSGQFMWELDGILGATVMTQSHIVQKLVHDNVVPAVGNAIRSFLRRLLSVRPELRPTATACIRKKLFKRAFPVSREPFGDQLDVGENTPEDVADAGDVRDAGVAECNGSAGAGDGNSGGTSSSGSTSTASDSSDSDDGDGDAAPAAIQQRPGRKAAAPPRRRRRGGFRR